MTDLSEEEADGIRLFGAQLTLTCMACPEQYNVVMDDTLIGYLRLRHGHFTARYPDCSGILVFEAYPENGDGIFYDHERYEYLYHAVNCLVNYHKHRED